MLNRRLSVLALLAGVVLPVAARAQSDLAPDKAEQTFDSYKWRCAIIALCPYSAEIWETLRQAIAGKPGDQYMLGIYLVTGDKVLRDEHAGLQWFGVAAQQGYARAALELNRQRRNGADMDVDETRIATAMRAKADAGDADAMRALSDMYIYGRGVGQDPKEAMQLLRRAADSGSSAAQQDLANLLIRGAPGITPDRKEALQWMTKSAGSGNTEAMRILSYMLINPPSGNDYRALDSYRWLLRAALLDDPEAQEKLSQVYADGMDVSGHGIRTAYGTPGQAVVAPDLVQADKWFRLAARNPWHNNPQIRAIIEPRMTTAQLDEARRLAADWHPLPLPEVMALDIAAPVPKQ